MSVSTSNISIQDPKRPLITARTVCNVAAATLFSLACGRVLNPKAGLEQLVFPVFMGYVISSDFYEPSDSNKQTQKTTKEKLRFAAFTAGVCGTIWSITDMLWNYSVKEYAPTLLKATERFSKTSILGAATGLFIAMDPYNTVKSLFKNKKEVYS